MSELLAEIEVSIQAREQSAAKTKEYFTEHRDSIISLLDSGDKAMVKLIWNKLRTVGYVTELNPAENEVNFSGWWYMDDQPRIWLSFSSTVCKRVKVGTKTQVIDVFEVVCE